MSAKRKLHYVRLPAFHHLTDGLSFDVTNCAEVLDTALVGLNEKTGIPDEMVRWNRRGGHAAGPLRLGKHGRIAIEVTESFSIARGKLRTACVIENKDESGMGPVVLLKLQSLVLDIPMRVELPLRAILRGGPDLEGTYVVYLHALLSDDGKSYVYYGITRRGWNYRFGEHMKAALKERQTRLFPQKLAELIEARLEQRAGRSDDRPKLAGVITSLCSVGIDKDMAKDTEEYLVDKYSLASKHSLGLNMIPGGREGIRLLHQLSGKGQDELVDTDARERALVDYREKNPQAGVLKPGVAAAWADSAYAEAVICGRENRLSADQVRQIRYLAAIGSDLASIKATVGAIDEGQVRRVLAGRTYGRIR